MPGHIADFMYAVENWKLVTLNLDLNKEPQSVFDFKESQEILRSAAALSCFKSLSPRPTSSFGLQTLDHERVTHLALSTSPDHKKFLMREVMFLIKLGGHLYILKLCKNIG